MVARLTGPPSSHAANTPPVRATTSAPKAMVPTRQLVNAACSSRKMPSAAARAKPSMRRCAPCSWE